MKIDERLQPDAGTRRRGDAGKDDASESPRLRVSASPCRLGLGLAVLLAVAFGIAAHEGHDALPTKGASVKGDTVTLSPEARKALDLRVSPVEKRTLERTILSPATVVLKPRAHAFATTQLAGRVERVHVVPGQKVEAGEKLALVRSPELERLQTEALTARLELELADKKLGQAEDLARERLGAPLDLLAARNRRQEKANTLRINELKLQALGLRSTTSNGPRATDYGLLPIRSPIAGVVAHVEIVPGMIIDPQQHVLEIADASQVWVRADVPEAYVRRIALGNEARMGVQASGPRVQTLSGRVRARQGKVDPKTLAEPVWIEVQASNLLLPGMAGQAQIVVERRENVPCVPELAVVRDGIETFVFVQTEPGKYERTRILTGLSAGGYVQVTGGLFSMDAIVTQGQRQLASLFVQGVLRPSPQARKNTGLRVEPAGRQVVAPVIELDAVLEVPRPNAALVASPLPGKLAELYLTEPKEVATGEPLASIASLDFQGLQFELIQADLTARLQRETLDAYQKADPDGKGIIPGQLRIEARVQLEIAEARIGSLTRRLLDIELTRSEIETIRRDQKVTDRFVLRASRRGHAIPHPVTPGQVLSVGAPLFEIQDRSRMWARGRIHEQDLTQVKVGQLARLRLTADSGFLAETRIARLGSLPEGETRIRSVWATDWATDWAEPDSPAGFLAENMLARLAVQTGPGVEVLAVPLAAVTRDGSRTAVFVHDARTDQFTLRTVELGRRDDRFVEVKSGLKPGEVVAVSAVAELRRGYGRIK